MGDDDGVGNGEWVWGVGAEGRVLGELVPSEVLDQRVYYPLCIEIRARVSELINNHKRSPGDIGDYQVELSQFSLNR